MTRRKVRADTLRKRLLQRRGIIQDKDQPAASTLRFRNYPGATPNALKTNAMLLKEIEYNQDIAWILSAGPLIHNTGGRSLPGNCRRCVWCKYHIAPSTASKWRKRLGISHYEEVAS